jgi:hypothetical protein
MSRAGEGWRTIRTKVGNNPLGKNHRPAGGHPTRPEPLRLSIALYRAPPSLQPGQVTPAQGSPALRNCPELLPDRAREKRRPINPDTPQDAVPRTFALIRPRLWSPGARPTAAVRQTPCRVAAPATTAVPHHPRTGTKAGHGQFSRGTMKGGLALRVRITRGLSQPARRTGNGRVGSITLNPGGPAAYRFGG